MWRLLLIAPMAWLACTHRAPAPIANHAQRPAERAAPAAATDATCAGNLRAHRVTLELDRETEIAAGGERATYHGQSEDLYDDGTSAIVLALDVLGQPWLPDARDTGFHAFGEHCVRVVTSTDHRLELEVALQPAHEYDDHRCQFSCCAAPEQRAPDGSVECCFCSDAP